MKRQILVGSAIALVAIGVFIALFLHHGESDRVARDSDATQEEPGGLPALGDAEFVETADDKAKEASDKPSDTDEPAVDEVERGPPLLRGRVVDGRGKPVAGVQVSCSPVGDVDPRISQYRLWMSYGRTGADGRFAIPSVAAGVRHRVRAVSYEGRPMSESIEVRPPAKDLEIEVVPK